MKYKEIKIQVPKGYEIDKKNSTFECIKFKPVKNLTYDDIARELFTNNPVFYINSYGNVSCIEEGYDVLTPDSNCAVSEKQCQRLLAINQLMNVAYYFNEIVDKNIKPWGRYVPIIAANPNKSIIDIGLYCLENKNSLVWFKTKESIKKAIEILGEETIKLAISL